jgi:RHS repeat-associated protein
LGLQYSSARHQRETGHFNHVGHGWDLLGESTLMKADPSNPAGSTATMVLNGASYTIDTSRWFSKEDPFIQMWEYLTPTAGFPYYQLKVRTQDGMLYTFKGYANISDDDNPWPPAGEPPMVFKWKTGQNNECGGYANLDWVKLPLVQVQDPSGNVIQYTWTAASTLEQGRHGASDVRTDDYGCHYLRTLRLSEIRYNFEGATAQTRIKLRYDNGQPQANLRYDRSDAFDQWGGMHLFAIYKLLGVDVVALNGSGLEQVVRQYNVNYHDQCAGGCDPNKGNTLLLPSQIVETAGGVGETTSFVYRDRNGVQNKALSTACDYGYLGQMDNPYGGRSSFTAELFTAQCGSSRPPRVQTYTMTDLVTNQPNWTWEYAAFTWEVDTHGYAQVNVLWPSLGDGVRRLEQHFFKQKETLPGTTTQIDHLAGREWKTVACLPASASPSANCASGGELTRSETDWAHTVNDMPVNGSDLPAEQRPRFVYAQQSRSYRETLPMVRTDYGYEKERQNGSQLGNLTYQQERLGSGSAWAAAALRTTYTQYYPNLTYWVVNKPAWSHFYEKCYDVPGQADPCDGGVIKRAVRNYYDGATSPDGIVPDKGRLTRQEKGEGSVWEDTRFSYTPDPLSGIPDTGNLLKVERMNGGVVVNSTETFYDSRFRAYPVCTKNILGHTTQQRYYGVPGSSDAGCTTTAGSNLPVTGGFFGQLEQAIDENGQGTALQYDGLGRIWLVIRPGDSAANPTVRFSYTAYSGQGAPFWIKKEQRDGVDPNYYLETRSFYDGFGRVIQSQAEAASASQSIVASTQYNAAGQVLQQNTPYFHPAALGGYRTPDWGQPKTATTYDAYGRAKQVTNPDSSKTCTTYQGLQTAVVYEQTAGATYKYFQKISATDQLGRLSSVKDYTVALTPATAACPAAQWSAGVYGTTSYEYDVADRLRKTTGPDSAQITITYDALGRKTQMIDPDMGTWTYAYDQLSNLTRQTDARGQTVCFYYDGLNRLRGKHTRTDLNCPAWTSNPSLAAQYTYDAGSNGIGRRTGMTDGSGSASWTYDSRGRVTSETKVVSGAGGGTFVTNWTAYDALDRVRTMQYPDGEVVTLNYTSQGPLKGVSGTSVYVGDTLYNALGQVTDRYLGSTTGQIRQKYTYPANENFRLTALQSGVSPNFNNLQNITYTYDDQGNVLTVVDAAAFGGSQTQTFTYDALNRLLTAQASGGSYGTYTLRSYSYTNAGNIDSFEGATLGYDPAHKHAVTHVNSVQKYWYDQNGNATRRINGSQDVTLVYDAENHVTSITGSGVNATYVYDGDGKRVKATVGGVTTVYIGNYYERDNGTTVRKYYYAGAVRVAMRTGGNTFYLLNDHLTSTAITTNSSGARLNTNTELRYFPYGAARYDTANQQTIYRYTGQRIETGTGLYDYGARWYDPLIGRFLSADSIVPNPGDSQALNRYMYVLGNPLKYSDPSGHAACAADDRACWENEWYWKNRWYNAHGYFHDGNHWGRPDNAVFGDEGILREVLAEAGITAIGQWDFGQLSLIGQGVVALYQAIGSMSRLNDLLGPVPAFIERQRAGPGHCSTMGACTFGPLIQFYDALFSHDADYIRGTAVHELAHVIDFWGRVTVSGSSGRDNTLWPSLLFPGGTYITDHAMTGGLTEYWAEAVTDWVYGGRYKGPYDSDRNPLSEIR